MRQLATVLLLGAAFALAQTFTNTAGPMQQARALATATLLPDGTVLVAGGRNNGQALSSAEIFDPSTSTFHPTGSMTTARAGATAQPLPDGRILVIGGEPIGAPLTTDIYDPAKDTFAAGPSLTTSMDATVSALLPDGRIFITGIAGGAGCGAGGCSAPVEIYDPASGQLAADGALQLARSGETATALDNGKVLIFNGWSANAGATTPSQTYEVYDAASGTSTLLTANTIPVFGHTAVKLHDGTVLICGGGSHNTGFNDVCELFDPTAGTVAYTTGKMSAGRNLARAELLGDGRVLIAGGNQTPPDAEIYDPHLGTFTSAGNFNTSRDQFAATLLADGSVLAAGGYAPTSTGGYAPASTGAYAPASTGAYAPTSNGSALASAEVFAAGTATPDFSIAADNTILTDSTAASVSFKITAAAANGFSGAIALSCAGAGSATCAFAPASITSGQTSTLTVSGLDLSQGGVLDFQVVGTSGALQHNLALRIALEPPVPQLAPATLSFGDETVGQTSATQKITLANSGEGTLHISRISTQGDFAQTNDCPATLAGGAPGCTITVSFKPTAAGARSGALQITDDAPFSPQSVALTGIGKAAPTPAATLAPGQLDFGQQTVGASSSAQTITLTNSGTADMTVQKVAATGDFSATSRCPATLSAGANCTVGIVFTPTAAGSRTGQLQVSDGAPGSPPTAALSGSGVAAADPNAVLTPSSLSFPDQAVNSTSAAQVVTLTNGGPAALTIAGVAVSGDFAATNNCGQSLAAGGNCAISVTFTPTATGARTGQLAVTDNGNGSPQTVTLSGNGTAAPGPTGGTLTLAPAAGGSATATVAPGSTAEYNLAVQSTSGATGNVNLTCSGAPAGAACTVTPAAITLGASLVPFTVKVTTTAPANGWVPVLPGGSDWPWLLLAALALVLAAIPRRRRALAPVALACLLTACGGGAMTQTQGTTVTPTPAGSYQLTITATPTATNTPAATEQLTLIVQ
ncbi:MAG TPA: choice-of-anchor D domain-containing protein [Terriglobales bacterium]